MLVFFWANLQNNLLYKKKNMIINIVRRESHIVSCWNHFCMNSSIKQHIKARCLVCLKPDTEVIHSYI